MIRVFSLIMVARLTPTWSEYVSQNYHHRPLLDSDFLFFFRTNATQLLKPNITYQEGRLYFHILRGKGFFYYMVMLHPLERGRLRAIPHPLTGVLIKFMWVCTELCSVVRTVRTPWSPAASPIIEFRGSCSIPGICISSRYGETSVRPWTSKKKKRDKGCKRES